jgi:nucleotide-binding universal stress UspA family protein
MVATDLSARSDRAVERTLLLAADLQAKLTVLHVVDEDLPARIADRYRDEAQALLAEQLSAKGNGSIEAKVVFGRGADTILSVAEDREIDLIVLGLHRNETSRPMFLGTAAERVVRAGRWPVLIVKNRANKGYERILIGIDFSVYSRCAVELAVNTAPRAEFYLVHAYDLPFRGLLTGHARTAGTKRYEQKLVEHISDEFAAFVAAVAKKPERYQQLVREGSARQVLHQELERLAPDLLVVGTHGRTGVSHALLGSVAEDMLNAPACDVLVVKAW